MSAFETHVPAATTIVTETTNNLPLSQGKIAASFPFVQGSSTIDLEKAESGVTLELGERFLLDLGERGWKIRIGNETILAHIPAPHASTESLGYFQALSVGRTVLAATSSPPNHQNAPSCRQPTLFLQIPITVVG